MLNIERHQRICSVLKSKGSVTVSELQEMLRVSEMTIRRDLKTLSEEGFIKRVHGGATYSPNDMETPFVERSVVNIELKQAIAEFALHEIERNDSIFIDASTTCSELAEILPEDMDLTVFTNSLEAIIKLRRKTRMSVLTFGGGLAEDGNTFDGLMTNENAEKITVNKCFISASGFIEKGVLNPGMIGTAIKKILLRNSRRNYLLADSTKYDGMGIIELCKWPEIDVFICDDRLPKELQAKFANLVKETHFVIV